jgi:hypothetical protein
MIEYSFSRVELLKDRSTNNIVGLIIGMSANDSETNMGSYVDTSYSLPTPVASLTNDEIRNICLQVAQEKDWYVALYNQIQSLNNQPESTPVSGI